MNYNHLLIVMTQQFFCFTLLSHQPEAIIQIVLTVLSIGLIGDAIRKFCAMRGSHNSHVTKIYILVLFWWGTFVASNSYGVAIYFISKDNNLTSSQMSTLTKYSFVITWINAYSIQWILLLVPYQWGKQITDLFSHISRGSSEVTVEDFQQYKGIQRKMYLTLKCYFYLRLLFLGLPIAILLTQNTQLSIFYKIMIAVLLLDCTIITCSLVVGMYSLKTTKQLREQLDQDQAKRVFNQYLLIIVANTIRFGFDISYIVSSILLTTFFKDKCPDYGDKWIEETIVNTCTIIFSHFLPIFIILRIYNLEDKPQEMCKSLIIASNQKDI